MSMPKWVALAIAAATCSGVAIGIVLGKWNTRVDVAVADIVFAKTDDPRVERAERAGARRDIVLITVDTLRADMLGPYGDERGLTPWLSSLAESGVVFERAYASSSWTVPTVATLMTGLFAHQHGVERGAFRRGKVHQQQPLPPDFNVLAERFQKLGYRTFGVTTNAHLGAQLGYDQGFQSYLNLEFQDSSVVHAAIEDLAPLLSRGDSPFLLWVHLFDPHDPYRIREPWFSELQAGSLEDAALVEPPEQRRARAERWAGMTGKQLREHRAELDDPLNAQTLRDLYAAEVRYSDEWIKRIVLTLGAGPKPVIVFTADHGEELLDHGSTGHRQSLHDELVRVPLIVSAPGMIPEGLRVAEPVSLVDLLPTLVDLAGGDRKDAEEGTVGRSLKPLWAGGDPGPKRWPIVMTVKKGDRVQQALVDGPWKLVVQASSGVTALFDLRHDPAEQADVSAAESVRVEQMGGVLKAELAYGIRAVPTVGVAVGDEDTLEMLEAMGYVDQGADQDDDP